MKKIRFSIAIFIPISATRRALPLKFVDSALRSPYSATKRAPETLNRSVMFEDISAFNSNERLVYPANLLPIHFVGMMKMGSRTSETRVICQESVSIAAATRIRVSTLLITPERVEVKACCAPMTSELIREISEPV